MSQLDFTRLLFRAAFCVMACDGEIDDREIEELRLINEKTRYFAGLDLEAEIQNMLGELRCMGRRFVQNLFRAIEVMELNVVQELRLLEVCTRIVNADEKVEENEVRFLRCLRQELAVHDELVVQRFGRIEYLVQSGANAIEFKTNDADFWTMPPFRELEKVRLDNPAG